MSDDKRSSTETRPYEEEPMKRTTLLLIAAVIAVPLLFASGCRKSESTAKLGLESGGAATSTEAAGSAVDGAASKSSSSIAATSTSQNTKGSTTSGSGSSGSSNSNDSQSGSNAKPSGGTTKPSTSAKTTTLKILWWNDTVSKKPERCEVVYGSAAYRPDVSQDAASGFIKAVPVGKAVNLVIYPDGRAGKKIIVPFKLDSYMKAGTNQDAIHVAISDDTVKVLGNPVEGFEAKFDRF